MDSKQDEVTFLKRQINGLIFDGRGPIATILSCSVFLQQDYTGERKLDEKDRGEIIQIIVQASSTRIL